ncbi:MAG: hypothetical protein NVS3B19_13470 [Ginsengibacter sp.]
MITKTFRYVILISVLYFLSVYKLSAQPKEVTLQLKWWHQFQFAGYYAAQIQGYYQEEKLKVNIVQGDIVHSPLNEVVNSHADFGVSGCDIIVDYAKGAKVVVLNAIFQHSPYVILSLKKNKISTPSDLIGKRIMASDGQGWVQLEAMLLKEGVPLDSLKIVQHTFNNDDLINGKADAMTAYSSVEVNQLKSRGIDINAIVPSTYGIDFYGDVLFTRQSLLNTNPTLVESFRKASLKGWEYAMKHPEQLADYILTLKGVKERGETKETLLAEASEMKKLILPDVIEIGHMNEGRWDNILKVHQSLSLISKVISLDNFIYNPVKSSSTQFFKLLLKIGIASLFVFIGIIIYSVSLKRAVSRRTDELLSETNEKNKVKINLYKSEERLEMATKAAGIGIWDWDIMKGNSYFSDIWLSILGYEPGDIQADYKSFVDLIHPEDQSMLLEHLNNHVDGKTETYEVIFRLKTKDNRWKWILSLSKASERDENGKATRLIGIHMDFSDIKQKELELSQLSKNLINKNEGLQQFAYMTSHNLRAPVANLLSLVSLFKQDELSEKNKSYFDKINFCVNHLNETLDDINRILSESIADSARLHNLDLEQKLVDIIKSIDQEISETSTTINYDFTEAPIIKYSEKVIDSIYINLISNSIKYRRIGIPPIININSRVEGRYVVLNFKDNGTGMDMDKFGKKVFGLYERFNDEIQGKGIGLYLIKKQITGLGGTIDIKSSTGNGMEVIIQIKIEE